MTRARAARRARVGAGVALAAPVVFAAFTIAGSAALDALGPRGASAQSLDPRRARTFLVGGARGVSPTDRVDSGRTGFARTALPPSNIHVEWRKALGSSIDHAPLVDDVGNVIVVAGRGDVVVMGPDGAEKSRAVTGAVQAGPPVLLSDGTIVFVSAGGEALGVRGSVTRFRTRVGRSEAVAPRVAPLALDDGGVVVGTVGELTVLDAQGNVRARTSTPEAVTSPLVSALGKVAFVGASGAVYLWAPGGDPSRAGSFGAPIDGGAALSDDHTLVAVTHGGTQLTAVDLVKNVAVTRSSAPVGVYLGPPAMRGDVAYVVSFTSTGSTLVGLDANGLEVARVVLTSTPLLLGADGGVAPLVVPPHAGALVDAAGTVVVAAPEGPIGVATSGPAAPPSAAPSAGADGGGASVASISTGSVEFVSDLVCSRGAAPGGRPASSTTGIAPAGNGAFVVACSNGALVKVSQGTR